MKWHKSPEMMVKPQQENEAGMGTGAMMGMQQKWWRVSYDERVAARNDGKAAGIEAGMTIGAMMGMQ